MGLTAATEVYRATVLLMTALNLPRRDAEAQAWALWDSVIGETGRRKYEMERFVDSTPERKAA